MADDNDNDNDSKQGRGKKSNYKVSGVYPSYTLGALRSPMRNATQHNTHAATRPAFHRSFPSHHASLGPRRCRGFLFPEINKSL